VDRDLISPLAQAAGAALKDRAGANSVLTNAGDRRSILARFKGYARFTRGYLPGSQVFGDSRYFFVHTLELAGYRVALLGLTSAWLARGGDEDHGRLVIGERQARAALEQAGDADFRIALLHHPFDWLQEFDREDSATLLANGCDFILHGHMHKLGLLQARGPDSNAMIIAAGACYDSREHPNSYNLVRLDLSTGEGTVILRTYSDKSGGFWTKDVMNFRNVPDGVYAFTLPARKAGGL
jgi:predicted phosphodiesterase